MEMVKPLVIACKSCGEIIEVYADMISVYSKERNMGAEIQYEAELEEYCPECDKKIYISIDAWEYPEGAVNYVDVKVEGADIIKQPVFECIY